MLISSFDRWTSALLADDGIDMPFMGGNETISATIIAKDNGILAGCAAVDHMLQIWAASGSILATTARYGKDSDEDLESRFAHI